MLSDPDKRKQYESFGSDQFSRRYSQEEIFRNFDLNEILRDFGFGGREGMNGDFGVRADVAVSPSKPAAIRSQSSSGRGSRIMKRRRKGKIFITTYR